MAKAKDIIAAGGVLPALASGAMGAENRGFALGLIPGFMYKDYYRDKQRDAASPATPETGAPAPGMKKGGKTKMKSASARADGCAVRGKTRGKIV